MDLTSTQTRPRLLLSCTLVLCILAYWASLNGGFLFDDYNTLFNNSALRSLGGETRSWLAVAFSSDAGWLRRPISMLSFGLNVSLFGMSPWAFKAVNLAIHLGNGLLFYALAQPLAERLVVRNGKGSTINPQMLALVVAAIWVLHPLNVSGVAYIVQRMNELAAFFTLAGLLVYVNARTRMLLGESSLPQGLFGLFAFGILAVLSKENGVLIVAFAWVIEITCFRFETPTASQRRTLKAFFWLTLGLPLALLAIYLITQPNWPVRAYAGREFSLLQRLLTEPRIMGDYLLWIFVPNPGWMGMYHDDIATSTGLFSPISTLSSIIFIAALCGLAWTLRNRLPAFAFAVGWFLMGHSMESTILPLELVFEHRNYLPMSGLILGLVCLVGTWLHQHAPARINAIIGTVLILGCAGVTSIRASQWGDPLKLAMAEAANHPDSPRSQYAAGRALVIAGARKGDQEKAELAALPFYARAASLDPNQIHAPLELILAKARQAAVPDSDIAELASRLGRVKYSNNLNPFMDLLVAASNQNLHLTPEQVATLVDAALKNKLVSSKFRARIKNNYAAYQFNILHEHAAAIRLLNEATKDDPTNPYYEISLAQIAGAMQQPAKALEHLRNAQGLDKTQVYAQEIATMRAELQKN